MPQPTRTPALVHILDGKSDRIQQTLDNNMESYDPASDREAPVSLFWDAQHKFTMNSGGHFDFKTTYSNSEPIKGRNRVVIPSEGGDFFHEFIIDETIKNKDTKEVYSTPSERDLKKAKVIDPGDLVDYNVEQASNYALADTEWSTGIIESNAYKTIGINKHTNPFSLVKQIANTFNMEIRFRIEVWGHHITGRYVDFLRRRGTWRGTELTIGKNLKGIKRTEKSDEIVTALKVIGPVQQDDKGNETQNIVEVKDEQARSRWTRTGAHLWDKVEYDSEDNQEYYTETRLRRWGEDRLEERIKAAIEYKADAVSLEHILGYEHEVLRLGDTIRIKDTSYKPALYMEARIFEITRSLDDPSEKTFKLGDWIRYDSDDIQNMREDLLNRINRKAGADFVRGYAEKKKVKGDTAPSDTDVIWIDTSQTPNVVKTYNGQTWTKATPTLPEEVGTYGKTEIQQRIDEAEKAAENAAKRYAEDYTQEYAQGKVTQSTTAPKDPATGDLWIDISGDTYQWRRWDGMQWNKITRTDAEDVQGQLESAQIQNQAILSDKLADLAVTKAKVDKLAIDNSKLTDDAVNNAKLAADAVQNYNIGNGEIDAGSKLANLSVTAGKLADGSVGNGKILDDAINNAKIAADAVQEINIQNGAINNDKLQDLAVDANKLAGRSVQAKHIANLAVGTAAIADAAITNAKIQELDASKITSGYIAAKHIQIGSGSEFSEGYDPTKIDVGGRNLIRNGDLTNGDSHWNSLPEINETDDGMKYVSQNYGWDTNQVIDDIKRQTYTLSVLIRNVEDNSENEARFYIRSYKDGSHVEDLFNKHITISNDGEWKRLSYTFTITEDATDFDKVRFYFLNDGVREEFLDFSRFQVEKGDRATDFTPAPEDDREYTDEAIKPANDRINLWQYSDTTYIDGGNIYADTVTANEMATGTITAKSGILADASITSAKIAEAAIGTAAIDDAAITSAKIKELDAKLITSGTVAAEHVQIGSGSNFDEGFDPSEKETPEGAQQKINNTEIGGRNLFSMNNVDSHSPYNTIESVSDRKITTTIERDTSGSTNLTIRNSGALTEKGKRYTLSGIFKKNGEPFTKDIMSKPFNRSEYEITDVSIDENGFVIANYYAIESYSYFIHGHVDAEPGDEITIEDLKFERGDKATDWTPAPEDQRDYTDSAVKPVNDRLTLWQYSDTTYIDGGNIYADTITTNHIASGSITTSELDAGSVSASALQANAVTASKIDARAVNTPALAANAVVADKINADAITATKIAANTIQASHIAANVIDSNMIVTDGLDASVIKFGTMDGDRIKAGTIGAERISTSTLSAISADLGTVNAGTLNAVNVASSIIRTSTFESVNGGENLTITSGRIRSTDQLIIEAQNGMRLYGADIIRMENGTSIDNTGGTPRLRRNQQDYIAVSDREMQMWLYGDRKFRFYTETDQPDTHTLIANGRTKMKGLNRSTRAVQFRNNNDSGYIEVMAAEYTIGSSEKTKENFESLGLDVMKQIMKTPIYTYTRKPVDEDEVTPVKVGTKFEEMPVRLRREGETIDIYGMVTYSWKGLQELHERINALEKEMEEWNNAG